MDHWLSWREEATFGGSLRSSDPLLGFFHYQSRFLTHEFFLDYVLAHEMGHLFDFANGVNSFDDCHEEELPDGTFRDVGACNPKKGTFGEISWDRSDHGRGVNEYPLRAKQCSYFCNGHFESDLLKSKRDYVRIFLAKPFYYPGETTITGTRSQPIRE